MLYIEIKSLVDEIETELRLIPFSSVLQFTTEGSTVNIQLLDGTWHDFELGYYDVEIKSSENYPSIFGGNG